MFHQWLRKFLFLVAVVMICVSSPVDFSAQRKSRNKPAPAPASELSKLREDFVNATNEYKSSLVKLLAIYETNVKKAEEKLDQSRKLFADGLIARAQVEQSEQALAAEQEKLAEGRRQLTNADEQIAAVLVETAANEEISKNLKLARQRLVRTTAFVRYSGAPGWNLSEAWKIQRFFSDTFNKPLPVAVFGQGAIHERWRLDHRNALDISLHPDGPEGRAVLEFLQKNGIPYSAFRTAIPGTATGPHIHIGRPSHRY